MSKYQQLIEEFEGVIKDEDFSSVYQQQRKLYLKEEAELFEKLERLSEAKQNKKMEQLIEKIKNSPIDERKIKGILAQKEIIKQMAHKIEHLESDYDFLWTLGKKVHLLFKEINRTNTPYTTLEQYRLLFEALFEALENDLTKARLIKAFVLLSDELNGILCHSDQLFQYLVKLFKKDSEWFIKEIREVELTV